MSRRGKLPINIPEGVTVDVSKSNFVTVKGKLGELTQQINQDMIISIEDGVLTVKRPTEQKRHRAFHGLSTALIRNMVVGVSEGFEKKLEVIGVGYRASLQGQLLELNVGYSHPIILELPVEIKAEVTQEKRQNAFISLKSADKQLVGAVAAKIRSFRVPEPYKGKGIRYVGEYVRTKVGKAAAE